MTGDMVLHNAEAAMTTNGVKRWFQESFKSDMHCLKMHLNVLSKAEFPARLISEGMESVGAPFQLLDNFVHEKWDERKC